MAAVSAAEAAASEGCRMAHGGARHNAQQGVQILRIRDGVLSTVEAAVSSAAAVTNEVAAAASTAAAAAAPGRGCRQAGGRRVHPRRRLRPAPYAPFMESVAGPETPVIAIELEAASQRLFPHQPPDADRFAAHGRRPGFPQHQPRGHHGPFTRQRLRDDDRNARRRVRHEEEAHLGRRLIDPIACNLHAKTTREFVYTPIETMGPFEDLKRSDVDRDARSAVA